MSFIVKRHWEDDMECGDLRMEVMNKNKCNPLGVLQ